MDMNTTNNEYIDPGEALSRVGGNVNLYKRLLGSFVNGTLYQDLLSAIERGELEEATRHAHSIKGVSANLSLPKVRAVSVELEQQLKDNTDYASSLDELKLAYDATITQITQYMDNN